MNETYFTKLGEISAAHTSLNSNLNATSNNIHIASDLQRELIVTFRSGPKSNELDPEIVRHLHASQRMRALELVLVEHVLVEHKRLGRNPLLGLNWYDIVSAHNFFAVSQTIVEADIDDRIRIVEERDEANSGAAFMRFDAALLV